MAGTGVTATLVASDDAARYRRATLALLAVTVLATAAAIAVSIAAGDRPRTGNWADTQGVVTWDLQMLVAGTVASLVARRQPGNRLGWILAAGGAIGALATAADAWGGYALQAHPGTLPGGVGGKFGSAVGLGVVWALLGAHLPLRFPSGQLVSRRWRFVAHAATAGAVLSALQVLHPGAFTKDGGDLFPVIPGVHNPIGVPGAGPIATAGFGIGLLLLFGTSFVAIASLVVRYRRALPEERLQLKWVVLTVCTAVAAGLLLTNLQPHLPPAAAALVPTVMPVLFLSIPASLGVAILRYRLYEVDVLLVRAIVYGSLAAFVTAVYVGVAVGAGSIVGSGDHPNLALSIAATAIVAVAFQPVRARVQRVANRLVYGVRATPYEVIAGFGHRMAEALSFDDVLPRMAEAAASGVGAAQGVVRLRLPEGDQEVRWPADGRGDGTRPTLALPVVHSGEVLGEIAVVSSPGEPLTPGDEQVLRDLASHAGIAMRNLRLVRELEQRLEDLRASRQRIVAAQDDERRRMERDIHDGAQQQLVALAMGLGLARTLLDDAPEQAAAILEQLRKDAGEALETLRDLARGLFPPLLAERGLVFALSGHVTKTQLDATVDGAGVDGLRFDPQLEAAVYFCVREALQNASKHAPGSALEVVLRWAGGVLDVVVRDHGPGFDAGEVRRGSGLQNMVDRIEAHDGTLTFERPSDGGSAVHVRVPAPVLQPAG